MFAPDIDWQWPALKGIPHSGPRRGRDEVRRVFETFGEEPLDFQQQEFVAKGDRVVVLGTYRARVKATGRIWESRFAHAWTIRAGTLQTFDQYFKYCCGSRGISDVGTGVAVEQRQAVAAHVAALAGRVVPIALLAPPVPARRSASVDPTVALRSESRPATRRSRERPASVRCSRPPPATPAAVRIRSPRS